MVVFVRDGCHLCDEAKVLVAELCAELGVSFAFTDVDADPELRARHNDHVPVTFVDGVHHARWFVDTVALRAALTA
ncbi:MAG: glutaredoxin family protein [Micropruina sp.]|nr:glutaredoxin family protein [Micropruina sp.]